MLIPFALLLIGSSFAIAAVHDWRKRFIPFLTWTPAAVGTIMFGIDTKDFTLYLWKLVGMALITGVLYVFAKKKFAQGDSIALFFASIGIWLYFPLLPLVISLLPLLAYVVWKHDRTKIPFVTMLAVGYAGTLGLLLTM